MQGFSEPKQAAPDTGSSVGEGGDAILLPAISKIGLPVAVFGVAFLILTFVLISLTSPDRFPVRIGTNVVRLSELEAQSDALDREEKSIAAERQKLTIESSATTLHEVRRIKATVFPVGPALLAIDSIRRGFSTSQADPISLPSVEVSASGGLITVGGEVHDKSGRSMQLLASFVDGLRGIRMFQHVSEPEYKELPSSDGSSSSPFLLTITLARE
jgi:hypothetical protein